jgi:hypothetical protein
MLLPSKTIPTARDACHKAGKLDRIKRTAKNSPKLTNGRPAIFLFYKAKKRLKNNFGTLFSNVILLTCKHIELKPGNQPARL